MLTFLTVFFLRVCSVYCVFLIFLIFLSHGGPLTLYMYSPITLVTVRAQRFECFTFQTSTRARARRVSTSRRVSRWTTARTGASVDRGTAGKCANVSSQGAYRVHV